MGKIIKFYKSNEVDKMDEDKKLDNLIKLTKLVLYFSNNSSEKLYKTKLQKLLFYTQFLYYKLNGEKLLADDFINDYFGPTIEGLDEYLNTLESAGLIKQSETNYGISIIPKIVLSKDDYSTEEKEVLKRVLKKFDKFTATEMSSYSYDEKLWDQGSVHGKIEIESTIELHDL
ncbi:MAG: hypothetical protein K0R09_1089 [Clostridiales bacterium]|nr:hypothetical protein [Clostridiales bacterium]